jgi:hypothetical protein
LILELATVHESVSRQTCSRYRMHWSAYTSPRAGGSQRLRATRFRALLVSVPSVAQHQSRTEYPYRDLL